MMTEALKCCPFCGASAHLEKLVTNITLYSFHCETPWCRGSAKMRHTEAEAIAAWNRRAPPASPTGRQLGPGKRDELPPIVSEIVPVWPSIGEIANAGWAWRNDKERETDSDDQRYFEHNWHSLPGLGEYVKAEILKRPEFARSVPPIVSGGVDRDARIRELEGALEPFAKLTVNGELPLVEKYPNFAQAVERARSALSKATGEGG